MKKTITITAYNRPEYLRQTIHDLSHNNTKDWTTVFGLEPGPVAVQNEATGIDFMPTEIVKNSKRLGVRGNPYNILRYVFEGMKSDINVYLEDDLTISPDVLDMANYYIDQIKDGLTINGKKILGMRLFTPDAPGNADELVFCRDFNPLGLVITKEQWNEYYKHQWFNDNHCFKPSFGWDWSLNGFLHGLADLYMLKPCVTRSNHIGRNGGTHCPPDFHDKVFGNIQVYVGPAPEYKIVDTVAEPLKDLSRGLV